MHRSRRHIILNSYPTDSSIIVYWFIGTTVHPATATSLSLLLSWLDIPQNYQLPGTRSSISVQRFIGFGRDSRFLPYQLIGLLIFVYTLPTLPTFLKNGHLPNPSSARIRPATC